MLYSLRLMVRSLEPIRANNCQAALFRAERSVALTKNHVSALVGMLGLVMLVLSASNTLAQVTSSTDDFESPTLDPSWRIVNLLNETVALSTAQNHTSGGHQSLSISTTGPGQRNAYIQRSLGGVTTGTGTIYFYDSGPGFYAGLDLVNSTTGAYADIGTQDFDPSCYRAFVFFSPNTVNGPNANCGPFPIVETTSIPRSIGWHNFTIAANGQSVALSIDGQKVFIFAGNFTFDTVQLFVVGPHQSQMTYYFDDFSFTPGCQVELCRPGVTDSCVNLSALAGMKASFKPSSGFAQTCNVIGFDWLQTIDQWPTPSGLFAQSAPTTPIEVPPGLPFFDPPQGGYTYQFSDFAFWSRVQPNFAIANPFYYSPLDIPNGCAETVPIGPCLPIELGDTLNFFDAPKNSCLPGGADANNPAICQGLQGSTHPFMGFTTQLVGYRSCTPSTVGCNSSGFMPSAPLFEWTWDSDFNGSTGGVFGVQTASAIPPDKGSGTGGITITSINGVQQIPPRVTCGASPNVLWPPNSKQVAVDVSGTITPGTSAIAASNSAFSVIDSEGQVQPSGPVTIQSDGTYSVTIPLVASRDGNNNNGRQYTIIATAADAIGNVGSCSTVVTVPHDQGH